MLDETVAVGLLVGGIALVIIGADAFFDGLLDVAARVRVSAFFLTVLVSGLEIENIAAGLSANLVGFPGAVTGTFLGGTAIHFLTHTAGILAIVIPLQLDEATMRLHLHVAVAAPAIFCLILRVRESLGRLEGALLSVLYATYIVVAVTDN